MSLWLRRRRSCCSKCSTSGPNPARSCLRRASRSVAWAEIFGDTVAVAAMVDRLVHHAEVVVLRGDTYRLKGEGKEVLQTEGAS